MAVAHDAASRAHNTGVTSTNEASFSWTHTPVGTPRGVLVFVFTNANSALITSVTYGGVTMIPITGGQAIDTTTEPCRTDLYYLGQGVLPNAQTIAVNRTNNATAMTAMAATVTAAFDTAPTGMVLVQNDGTLAEQSVNDGSISGANSVRYAAVFSGLASAPAAGASSTSIFTSNLTSNSISFCRETTAGTGARNVGFTGTSDDRAAVHVAITEIPNPALQQEFASDKSLTDRISNTNKITLTRGSDGTYIDSSGNRQTASSNVARFTHDPSTLESLGLLCERQSTNLLLNSATLSTQNVTVTAESHVLSFLGTGTVTLSGASTAGPLVGTGAGEANRVSLAFTPTAGTLTLTVSGTVSDAQLEVGDKRTSYIPTTGTQVTRSTDDISITGSNFSGVWSATAGSVYFEGRSSRNLIASTTARHYDVTDGTANERITGQTASSTTNINLFVNDGGVTQASITSGTNSVDNQVIRQAAGWAANNFANDSNVGALATDVAGTLPTVDRLRIGNAVATGSPLNGTISRFIYWSVRAPNGAIETWSVGGPPLANTAAGASFSIGVSLTAGAATVSATAAGATFNIGVSLSAGAATGEAVAAGASLSVGVSLQPGEASAAQPATADGAALNVGVSLSAGAATGAGTADGTALSIGAALTAGSPTAAAVANGASLNASAALAAGAATGEALANGAALGVGAALAAGAATGEASAAGASLSIGASFAAGAATGAAIANGATLSAGVAFSAGAATGAATANGAALDIGISLVAGLADVGAVGEGAAFAIGVTLAAGSPTAAAVADGASLAVSAAITAGAATGEAIADGAALSASAIISAGAATGAATANGAALSIAATFTPGAATAAAVAPGASLATGVSITPGSPSVPATAPGTAYAIGVAFVAGAATGDASAAGASLAIGASIQAGTAEAEAFVAGTAFSLAIAITTGAATGGASVAGAALSISASLTPGGVSAGSRRRVLIF